MIHLLTSTVLVASVALAAAPLADNPEFYGPASLDGRIQRLLLTTTRTGPSVAVHVGTPPQRLNLTLALAAPAIVLDPITRGGFNTSASSSYENLTDVSWDTSFGALAEGTIISRDTVSLPELASNLSVTLANVGVEVMVGNTQRFDQAVDYYNETQGAFGLGYTQGSPSWPQPAVDSGPSPLVEAIRAANLSSISVGIDLQRNATGLSAGQIHFGSVDKASYTNFTWVPTWKDPSGSKNFEGDWMTELEGMTFNGREISLANPNTSLPVYPSAAYIDTFIGATLQVPNWVYESITNDTIVLNTTTYIYAINRNVSCDSAFNLTLKIAGRGFHIDTRDLVNKRSDGSCYHAIGPSFLPFFRLGTPFLRSVYTALYLRDPAVNATGSPPSALGFAQKPVQFAAPANSSSPGTAGGGGTSGALPTLGGTSHGWSLGVILALAVSFCLA